MIAFLILIVPKVKLIGLPKNLKKTKLKSYFNILTHSQEKK